MTYRQFLEKLAETKHLDWTNGWYLDLRISAICPICAVANHIIGEEKFTRDYNNANDQVLHLEPGVARKIALASDSRYESGSDLRKIREEMLKALEIS